MGKKKKSPPCNEQAIFLSNNFISIGYVNDITMNPELYYVDSRRIFKMEGTVNKHIPEEYKFTRMMDVTYYDPDLGSIDKKIKVFFFDLIGNTLDQHDDTKLKEAFHAIHKLRKEMAIYRNQVTQLLRIMGANSFEDAMMMNTIRAVDSSRKIVFNPSVSGNSVKKED